jgi:hypothetical protein
MQAKRNDYECGRFRSSCLLGHKTCKPPQSLKRGWLAEDKVRSRKARHCSLADVALLISSNKGKDHGRRFVGSRRIKPLMRS